MAGRGIPVVNTSSLRRRALARWAQATIKRVGKMNESDALAIRRDIQPIVELAKRIDEQAHMMDWEMTGRPRSNLPGWVTGETP